MIAAELLHLMEHPPAYPGTVRDLITDLQDAAHSLHDYTGAQITELLLAAARVLDETEGTVRS